MTDLRGRTPRRWWRRAEDQILRENWGKIPACDIGAMLNRPHGSIIGRAGRIGLPSIKDETARAFMREGQKRAQLARRGVG